MMNKQALLEKRQRIDQFRQSSSLSPLHAEQLGQSIASSWQRSASAAIPKDRMAAPINHQHRRGLNGALEHALQLCTEDLKHIAQQSSMVIAVGDIGSTIVWSASRLC